MKIAVICNSDTLAFPSINYLMQKDYLAGVSILEKNKAYLLQPLLDLGVPKELIHLCPKADWVQSTLQWLQPLHTDAVWVFGFPWQIPQSLLSIPKQGFFNFHYGLFPLYRGADPVFWQLKNKESKGGLVIHKMTEHVDRGPVVLTEESPIVPGESYGLYCKRMGIATTNVLDKLLTNPEVAQTQEHQDHTPYFKKPGKEELTIKWEAQSSDDIEWLVNACNPKYGGASTSLRGMEMRFLEVAPADVADAPQTAPGTVIHADTLYGLIVACKDQKFIRINVVSMSEGYLSGAKLFSLGVRPGERFY